MEQETKEEYKGIEGEFTLVELLAVMRQGAYGINIGTAACDKSCNLISNEIKPGEPLPFKDGSVEIVKAWDLFAFIGDEFPFLMAEIHRVLIPGGILSVKVPEYPCALSLAHPYIKRHFTPFSFNFFENDFKIYHVESLERFRGKNDRGMIGSYETNLYIELIKPNPEFDRQVAEKLKELEGKPMEQLSVKEMSVPN